MIRKLLRSFRNDPKNPQSRSGERYRRAFLTSAASVLAKGLSALTGLISVPLTLHYLGAERYGLWMTISSVILFLGFSDLGINNGLLNGISKAHGLEDRALARSYVSSAFFFLTAVALVFGSLFAIAYPWIPWAKVFNVKSPQAIAEAGPAAAAFVLCFLVNIPVGIISRIQLGYQQGFAANLWLAAGNLLALGAVVLVIQLHGSLPVLVLAVAGAPIFALILNGLVYFFFQSRWLLPAWAHVRRDVFIELLRSGGFFFLLQLAMSVGFSTDNIVLAQVLGPQAVTAYSVPSKLFNLIAVLISIISVSLWPAFTEATVRQDHAWVKKTLKRTVVTFAITSSAMAAALLIFGPLIIRLWIGRSIQPSTLLMSALALWSVMWALSTPMSVFLNSANIVRFQVLASCSAAVVNIGLSIYLTRTIGISGVVFGSIISQFFVVLVPYCIYLRRYFRKVEQPSIAPEANDPAFSEVAS